MKTYIRENGKLLFVKGHTWLVTEMLSLRISPYQQPSEVHICLTPRATLHVWPQAVLVLPQQPNLLWRLGQPGRSGFPSMGVLICFESAIVVLGLFLIPLPLLWSVIAALKFSNSCLSLAYESCFRLFAEMKYLLR